MAATAFLFAARIVLALRVRGLGEEPPEPNPQNTLRWAVFGLLWGMIALLNSTILLFLPVCGVWMLLGIAKGTAKKKAALGPAIGKAVIAALIFLACLAPWMIHNCNAFHAFIPIRGNLGAELHDSVLDSYTGFTVGTRVPVSDVCPVYLAYKHMGEYAFVLL